MALFATTRKSYAEDEELTVDYGDSYHRNYHSFKHRAVPRM